MIINYIICALGVFLVLSGLAGLVSNKLYLFGFDATKYTEESMQRFAIPQAVINLLSGVAVIVIRLMKDELFKIGVFSISTGIVAALACMLLILSVWFLNKKVLVKR